ncbi:MAG: hypothetical protein H8Z69_04580 [Nanohaloarchaea archaeon]|nr:hypothetical protein [Candidatus Nanohaloarchaea archaeon]
MDVIAELKNTSREDWNESLYRDTCRALRQSFRSYPEDITEAVVASKMISGDQERIDQWYEARALMDTGIELEDDITWSGVLAKYLEKRIDKFEETVETDEDAIVVYDGCREVHIKSEDPSENPYLTVLEVLEPVFE